jgi:hypothetical protein
MRRYEIRVELDERFDAADVRLDLRTNNLHPLHRHDLHIDEIEPPPPGRQRFTVAN